MEILSIQLCFVGFANVPLGFQHMANDTFLFFLDLLTFIYLDEIPIFSKSQEEHDLHGIHQILWWL